MFIVATKYDKSVIWSMLMYGKTRKNIAFSLVCSDLEIKFEKVVKN